MIYYPYFLIPDIGLKFNPCMILDKQYGFYEKKKLELISYNFYKDNVSFYNYRKYCFSSHLSGDNHSTWNDEHILLIDTDQNLIDPVNHLIKKNLPFAIIQSSPNKYWFIIDYISNFEDSLKLGNTIEGVDTRYLDYASSNKVWSLRSFRKSGGKNKISYLYPILMFSCLKTALSKSFCEFVFKHFENDLSRKIYILNDPKINSTGRCMKCNSLRISDFCLDCGEKLDIHPLPIEVRNELMDFADSL